MKKIYYVFVMMLMAFLTLVAGFELYGIIRSSHETPIFAFFYAMHFFFSLLIFYCTQYSVTNYYLVH